MPLNWLFGRRKSKGAPADNSRSTDEQSSVHEQPPGQFRSHRPHRAEKRPSSVDAVDALLDELSTFLDATAASGNAEPDPMAAIYFGDRLLDPKVLKRARQRAQRGKARGTTPVEHSQETRVLQFLERLHADRERTADLLQAAAEFRATGEALNEFLRASSPEEASRVLAQHQTLLLTDLAVSMLQDKVEELRQAGTEEAAGALHVGPLSMLENARRHGVAQSIDDWDEHEKALAEAKEALRLTFERASADVVSAVNALMAARDVDALIKTLARQRGPLTQPSAAGLLRRSADVAHAVEDPSTATHLASLADVVQHLVPLTGLASEPAAWIAAIEGGILGSEPARPDVHAASIQHALAAVSANTAPRAWALLHSLLGRALAADVGAEGEARLKSAIAAFDAALSLSIPALDAGERTAIVWWKGQALAALSVRTAPAQRQTNLGEALRCYDDALAAAESTSSSSSSSDASPRVLPVWSIQLAKSEVLRDLADFTSGAPRAALLEQAIACLDAALGILSDPPPLLYALVLRQKGLLLSHLSDLLAPQSARRALEEAISIYDAALDAAPRDLDAREWAMNQSNRALALRECARLATGEERADLFARALQGFESALAVIQPEDGVDDWVTLQLDMGTTLGMLAERMGDVVGEAPARRALSCFDAALCAMDSSATPQRWAIAQFSKANILGVLAKLQQPVDERASLREAASCYDSALQILHRDAVPALWSGIQNSYGRTLLRLAVLQKGAKRTTALRDALERFDAALSILWRDDAPMEWANLQVNKGDTLWTLAEGRSGRGHEADVEAATACYDGALTVYTREDAPGEHLRVAGSAGLRLLARGQWNRAVPYLASALEALDDTYALAVTTYGQAATLSRAGDLAAKLAYALARAGDGKAARQAAAALERSRARATGEVMARQQAHLEAAGRVAPELLAEFRAVSALLAGSVIVAPGITEATEGSEAMARVESAPAREMATGSALAVEQQALRQSLVGYNEARALQAQYRTLVERIRAHMPEFLRPSDALAEVVECLEPTERLAYLCTTPHGAALVLLGRDQTGEPEAESFWDARLTTSDALQRLLDLHMALGNTEAAVALFTLVQMGSLALDMSDAQGRPSRLSLNLDPGDREDAFMACLSALGAPEGILAQVAARCQERSVQRLALIPCGLTGLLPLHAALIGTGVPEEMTENATAGLAEKALQDVVPVTYAPSGRVWSACRSRARRPVRGATATLVVGNPLPQPEASSLPLAELEARKVAGLLTEHGQRQVTLLVGEQATRDHVRSSLTSHAHTLTGVHFACHGFADLTAPHASALLLANGQPLTVGDLLGFGADPFPHLRLAVLSACETGLPGAELPDEVIGLPAGWLQAGAVGVVASLWPVDDDATRVLMQKFYELHLRDGLVPSDALWHAQRWLRGVTTWRSEQEAAGARRGAAGPDAGVVLTEFAATSSSAGATRGDDPLEIPHTGTTRDKPIHWAAFAYYGA